MTSPDQTTTIPSLYMRYLVADQIVKRMKSVGAQPGSVFFLDDGGIHINLAYGFGKGAAYDSAESREQIVNEFLTRYPDAAVDRSPRPYALDDKPQMVVNGVTHLGIHWKIDFRDGVCERVQVGTRKVESYDPEQLAALTKVEVEKPVYEYRCPDPIEEMRLALAGKGTL